MHNLLKKKILLLLCSLFLCFAALPSQVHASDTTQSSLSYTNPQTGYRAVVSDTQNLLSAKEQASLLEQMKSITAYGNTAFLSASVTDVTTQEYARSSYRALFGSASGTIFLIDMGSKNLWIQSNGQVYHVISTDYANTITDNIYSYASNGKYYQCSSEAFREIGTLLSGQHITQPMKYISNALLALILALMLNYGFVRLLSHTRKPSRNELLNAMTSNCMVNDPEAVFSHQTSIYTPPAKSSGGGGFGGGFSGGGGSGGGGGGGGHSF